MGCCVLDLPDEILVHILSYLSPDDIIRTSFVNTRFCRLATTESIWKYFCQSHCFIENKEKETWKDTYIDCYRRYGHHLLSETVLLRTWKKLMSIVQHQAPTLYSSLLDGMDKEDIAAWESKWHVKLPPSLQFLYRLCGGQKPLTSWRCPGLFGSLCNMDSRSLNTYYFCGLNEAEVFPIGDNNERSRLLTISIDHIGNKYCMVLPLKKDVANNCNVTGNYSIVWKSGDTLFHAADTLQQWIMEYTARISCGQYLIENNHILKYFYHPESVCQTGSIIAKAGWAAYKFWEHGYMQFEYRITLEMENGADPKEACQLHTRHWDITHFVDGCEETVEGPGVVGQYPVMKPGATFSWLSRTYFKQPGGSMSGHFKMRNLSSMADCVVGCPLYTMHFPEAYQLD